MSHGRRRVLRLLVLLSLLASGNARIAAAPPPEIRFSQPGGTFVDPFGLTLTCSDPLAAIRYTLDGSQLSRGDDSRLGDAGDVGLGPSRLSW